MSAEQFVTHLGKAAVLLFVAWALLHGAGG